MSSTSDGYYNKKGPIKNVIKPEYLDTIKDVVLRMNQMNIHMMQFIQSYYIFRLENKLELPIITENFVVLVYRLVSTINKRSNMMEKALVNMAPLREFFEHHFLETLAGDLPSRCQLMNCMSYSATDYITALENNIKMHYVSRVNRLVNKWWEKANEDALKTLDSKEAKEFKKTIGKITKDIKRDIIYDTLNSDQEYHDLVNKLKQHLRPETAKGNLEYDLQKNPQNYLPCMIWINNQLGKLKVKQFHCFPLRSDLVPKFTIIDTATMNKLFDSRADKEDIWNRVFNLKHKIFKSKVGYEFRYMVQTDGVAISVLFNKKVEENTNLIPKRKSKLKIIPVELEELPYVEHLSPDKLEKLKDYHLVYVDPNKGNLIYCMDDNEKIFRYSRRQRLRETHRLLRQDIKQRFKDKHGITDQEKLISEESSKTTKLRKFMAYLRVKNQANTQLSPFYSSEMFRRQNLRFYIDTVKSEANLVNRLKQTYQRDNREILLIYGNGNTGPQMRGVISTPMSGLKKRLSQDFKTLHLDEFRTSCLDWRTERPNGNVKVKGKDGTSKSLHSVLVSKILNKNNTECISYQNRDRNAVFNFRKIVQEIIKTGQRPTNYCRGGQINKKMETELSDETSIISSSSLGVSYVSY